MQKLRLSIIFIFSTLLLTSFHKPPVKEKLKWMTLAEAEAAMKITPKPILIDLYTDWCGWCKVMDKNTYTNSKLIHYLEEKFYPVKLNAETKDSLYWNGKTYAYNQRYRIHDLAIFLTKGELSFPSTIIINDAKATPQNVVGYMRPFELEPILKYFGEGHYGLSSYEDFQQGFKKEW